MIGLILVLIWTTPKVTEAGSKSEENLHGMSESQVWVSGLNACNT